MTLKVKLLGLAAESTQYPRHFLPEFAFIGRSNVGKSSLLNLLVGQKNIARVSKIPGKTRVLHFYEIENRYCLVDMPGYGYAKRSQSEKKGYIQIIREYLQNRKNLVWLFTLIDSRFQPLVQDVDFLKQCIRWNVPLALVFTKIDKLSNYQRKKNLDLYLSFLKEFYEELPPIFVTSSVTREGREALLKFIETEAERYAAEVRNILKKQ